MTDANLDPKLDLQISTLRQLCRGDVTRLPSFIVHDDEAWPWYNQVRPSKGDIHIRRSTFNRVVVGKVPLQPGLWVRQDAQQFFIARSPGPDGPGGKRRQSPGGARRCYG